MGEAPEIDLLEVGQGQKPGLGSVCITWKPAVPTSLGDAVNFPVRRVSLERLDDPSRLVLWLQERVKQVREKRKAESNVR